MARRRRGPVWRRRQMIAGSAPGQLAVDPDAPGCTVEVLAFDADGFVEHHVEHLSELAPMLARWRVTWVNVAGLGDAGTLQMLGDIFGIHRLALEDVVNTHQRAKVEEYDENIFIVARMPSLDPHFATEQVSMVLGPRYVVTFQERPGDCFEAVRARLRSGRQRIRGSAPDYLAYSLLDALVDSYFPIVERFGERIQELEDSIHAGRGRDLVAEIQDVRAALLSLRRAVWPHRDALRVLLHEELALVEKRTTLYLRDCFDHAVQVIELVEMYREASGDLMDLYLSQVSNRMNEIMQVLTVIATIFIPLGFIAGLYGMNFDPGRSPWNMPELGWYFGYPFALGLMLVVAGGLLLYFQRRGWLGRPGKRSKR